ncbi:DUF429 domain-containing protein [Variovorax sp. J22R133]|uniref:DUF429 domain-containing protein n=1 Tax=Variovorax brevis TaxID=3053503 RepID=UPI0025782722|nr:DUF429 domain-containing protein [Variovorax sp. J22R133]MDM0112931.1 DUF429 domain-containing protein [Variovorax sp. J22R133]
MQLLIGCDFSSAPSQRKNIVVATGVLSGQRVVVSSLRRFSTLDDWGAWLRATPSWVGAFDFPFGLPRELVEHLGWPKLWPALIDHYAALSRAEIQRTFAAFCAARPAGRKFAHRATDGPADSSPSMKWVNPPVAYMLHAGVPRLMAAQASFPGLHEPHPQSARVALEGYPGMLAREVIGRRSYKSDDTSQQTDARRRARQDLLAELERGATRLALSLTLTDSLRLELVSDARGDGLDAVLCLLQAAWGVQRAGNGPPGYGLPANMDPLEGWIVTA